MSQPGAPDPRAHRHGDIFARDSGAMLIHVQRESGLAHRTLLLAPWKVRMLRIATTKWFVAMLVVGLASWVFFVVQAARVPLLTSRIARMEEDARRLDTLQQALSRLQQRYDQVQHMLSAPSAAAVPQVKQGETKAVRPKPDSQRVVVKKDSSSKASGAKARSDSGAAKRPPSGDSVANAKKP